MVDLATGSVAASGLLQLQFVRFAKDRGSSFFLVADDKYGSALPGKGNSVEDGHVLSAVSGLGVHVVEVCFEDGPTQFP
ncbi:hypothetical protein [Corynebacterium riegelii]|uniref:hypothetical protein n=1 Tax=Corynebacterium riegelii TaxID=156976 RepID=UPI00191FDCB4|nr:hypothetical protein [Corynebacterium riegelii]QQU84310.1 hypothetical protein I6I71_01575 [Corynebacterium riegelii]